MHGVMWLMGQVLLYISGVLCETCLVYNYGSYTHRECDSCCDSGVHRRCCSDTPVGNKSSTSKAEVGIVFGCLVGLVFLVGLCGSMAKCCRRIRPRLSNHSSLSSDRPSVNSHLACLDSTGLQVAFPKPPSYSPWTPPPPYIVHDDRHCCPQAVQIHSGDCANEPHIGFINNSRCDDENTEPPPYTPRSTLDLGIPTPHKDNQEELNGEEEQTANTETSQ